MSKNPKTEENGLRGMKMSNKKICPLCEKEINHLNFDVTGTCSSQIYQSDILKGTPTDYDVDCLTDGAEFDNFRCPECAENICFSEEDVRNFLK